ncbi:MAG: hypothetical protein IH608_12200 [Proteobacteria bacterium]|nr:hypothetical protein [Pseudomonadota bacterium]
MRRAVRSAGPVAVTRVGTITDQPETIRLILPEGARRLEPTGWDHFASRG